MPKKSMFIADDQILLINFDYIFSFIQRKFLDDMYDYGLIKNNCIKISSMDAKKILFHHTIYEICEEFIKNRISGRRVLYIPAKIDDREEIFQYCEYEKFIKMYRPFLNKILKAFPIVSYICRDDNNIFDGNCDDTEQLVTEINEYITRLDNKDFSLRAIKMFCQKYNLHFLTEQYFNAIKTKQLGL